MTRAITARTDAETARSYWVMSRGDSERAFRRARRHSRYVRTMRIAIPLAVVFGLSAIAAVTYYNPLRMLKALPVNINDLVVSGTTVTMEQPRLSGFTRDARAYELIAEKAIQDLTKPDFVALHNIRAKVDMQDKSTVQMSARNGLYNSKNETLKLENDIFLSSSAGYSGKLSEALVNIRDSHVVSDKPVELDLLQGTLNANRLEILESGDLVRFHGGVVMDMALSEEAKAKTKR